MAIHTDNYWLERIASGGSSSSSSAGGGASTYSNLLGDFTATANNGTKTITLSSYASTVLSSVISAAHFSAGSVKKITTGGVVTTLPLTTLSFAANVLTLPDMEGTFAASDTVAVFVPGPDKGFTEASDYYKNSLETRMAGEDLTNDVQKVEQRFSYANIIANTTTTVKTTAGYLQQLTLNNPGKFTVADLVVTIYDNTAASGTKIGTWTIPVVATAQVVPPITLNVAFNTGLTIVTSGPTVAADLTVSYR